MSYNGWSNYETWRINLEMVDGMSLEDFGFDGTETVHAKHLGEMIREYCEDIIVQQVDGLSPRLGVDIVMSFLDMVDWTEIATHLIDAYIPA